MSDDQMIQSAMRDLEELGYAPFYLDMLELIDQMPTHGKSAYALVRRWREYAAEAAV